MGVAQGIIAALEADGLSEEDARARVYVFDSRGLVAEDRTDLPAYKRLVAASADTCPPDRRSLHATIVTVRPTALLGLSGHPGAIDADAA